MNAITFAVEEGFVFLLRSAVEKVGTFFFVSVSYDSEAEKARYEGKRFVCVIPNPGYEKALKRVLYHFEKSGYIMVPAMLNDKSWRGAKRKYNLRKRSLVRCIQEFGDTHYYYADPDRAYGMCGAATKSFLDLVRSTHIPRTRVPNICTGNRQFASGRFKDVCHQWAQFNNLVVDWTYRQYDASSPFPLVCSVSEYVERYLDPLERS